MICENLWKVIFFSIGAKGIRSDDIFSHFEAMLLKLLKAHMAGHFRISVPYLNLGSPRPEPTTPAPVRANRCFVGALDLMKGTEAAVFSPHLLLPVLPPDLGE